MADNTTREQFDKAVAKAAAPVPVEEREQANESILIGDDAVLPVRDVEVEVHDTEGVAVAPEVYVTVDARQDEASVLMPPEGIGTPDLPVWAFLGGKRVEDVFSEEAGETKQVSDEERVSAASEGRTARAEAVKKS